jgi:Mn-dependent DtxR family transcriptional regulator
VDLKGLGRQGYSEKGYSDIKIPILKEKGYIIMTSEDKFKLTDKGKEYCKESTVI